MRASVIAGCMFAFAMSHVSAQYYINQTAPFNLVLLSSNETYNGSTLTAVHEGAAIEGIAPGVAFTPNAPATPFYFNYSSQETPDPVLGYSGLLIYNLNVGFIVSEPMRLSINPTSDVALPLFFPDVDNYQTVGFDKDGLMFIASYVDDTVDPPKYETMALYRWYVCLTQYGYLYQTLTWVVGVHTHPQNPTCVKVDVKRVFI